MSKKIWNAVLIIINILGLICLIYYAVMYFMHDNSVPHPDAMLPMRKWEIGGSALTLGFVPLCIANILACIFVGRERIKLRLRLLFLLPCIICLITVVHFFISSLLPYEPSASAEPLVKVKLDQSLPKAPNEITYGIIYDDGGMEVIDEAFESDGTLCYTADAFYFESKIVGDHLENTVEGTKVTDNLGNEVAPPDDIREILEVVGESVPHDIIKTKVFKCKNSYFVSVQLNVNWQSPNDFYQYDASTKRLNLLYSWDSVDVLDVMAQ